jgi:glycosyltransferase involved in cell wall biosynthesis
MRIAVVTETYPPEVNGVALTVQNLVSGMAEDGHDLVLVRPFQPGVSTLPPVRPIHEMLVPGAALPKYPGLRFGFPAGRQLKRLFETRRPDAVYVATEGPLGWSAVRTARQLGIPVATGFHTRFDAYAGAYGLGPLTPLVRYWLRRLHNASGATVVPTPELRQWLERHGFQRVRVVARGVDTKLFDPARRRQKLRDRWGIAEGGLAVIYVGRIAAEKNLALAIESFRRIRDRLPDARFIWVGTGPEAARLAREHPDFVFMGLRLGEDLAEHFASADLFLFPSLTETFGNVTIEAMASGVPTIAFDYGAAHAHLVNREHGRVVASGDDAGFVEAAVELAADAGRQRIMGAAARRAALLLQPGRVSRDFVGMLAALTASKGTVTFKGDRPLLRRTIAACRSADIYMSLRHPRAPARPACSRHSCAAAHRWGFPFPAPRASRARESRMGAITISSSVRSSKG